MIKGWKNSVLCLEARQGLSYDCWGWGGWASIYLPIRPGLFSVGSGHLSSLHRRAKLQLIKEPSRGGTKL